MKKEILILLSLSSRSILIWVKTSFSYSKLFISCQEETTLKSINQQKGTKKTIFSKIYNFTTKKYDFELVYPRDKLIQSVNTFTWLALKDYTTEIFVKSSFPISEKRLQLSVTETAKNKSLQNYDIKLVKDRPEHFHNVNV